MRVCYRNRRKELTALLRPYGSRLRMIGAAAGSYALVQVDVGLDEQGLCAAASRLGVRVWPISPYFMGPVPTPYRACVLLGYGNLTKEQMACPLLSADEWKGLMTEACENGMLRAILTGGECLTHPGFREIYGHLKSLGCEVTVLSNAALLDDEWLRYFEKYRPGAICVTLYGDSDDDSGICGKYCRFRR